MEDDYVHNLLERLCLQPRTFEFLSKNMRGLDPNAIHEALKVLEEDGRLVRDRDYWKRAEKQAPPTLDIISQDPQLYLKKYMGHYDFLKMPHPLDFEWRNTSKSLNYLTDLITQTNQVTDPILIMGMPTLYAKICGKDIPQNVTLIEKNIPIVNALTKFNNHKSKVINKDVFNAKPSEIGRYYSVFMDPPWYSEHFYQFVWLAAQAINVGGFLVISIPPINTRPGIDKERLEWFSFCQQQGLCIENLYSEKLEYSMPFFEFNALRASGIKNVMPFWRKGDVAIFRKVGKVESERPAMKKVESGWIEKEVDTVRIRVNTGINNYESTSFEIRSLIKGDILPTVSTRHALREQANIWTSGNRIFVTSDGNKFLKCLERYGTADKLHEDEKTFAEFVKLITDLEQKEYNEYLDWVYYEMERQDH